MSFCDHSATLKRVYKTPPSFMHSHIMIWTRELWMCISCLWSKDLLQKTIARTACNSRKSNLGGVG